MDMRSLKASAFSPSKSLKERVEDTSCTSRLKEKGVAISAEIALTKMQILSSLVPAKTKNDWFEIRREPQMLPTKFYALPAYHQETQILSRYQNLQKQFCLVMGALKTVFSKINLRRCEGTPIALIEILRRKEQQETIILDNFSGNLRTIKNLEFNLQMERSEFQAELRSLDAKLIELDLQKDDETEIVETMRRYDGVHNRERCFHSNWINSMNREKWIKNYDDLINNYKLEQECHESIINCMQQGTELLQKDIDLWSEKYYHNLDNFDMKIDVLKNIELENLANNMAKARVHYKERKHEMTAWIKERDYMAKLEKACIKIQALWRGILVRRKIALLLKKGKQLEKKSKKPKKKKKLKK